MVIDELQLHLCQCIFFLQTGASYFNSGRSSSSELDGALMANAQFRGVERRTLEIWAAILRVGGGLGRVLLGLPLLCEKAGFFRSGDGGVGGGGGDFRRWGNGELVYSFFCYLLVFVGPELIWRAALASKLQVLCVFGFFFGREVSSCWNSFAFANMVFGFVIFFDRKVNHLLFFVGKIRSFLCHCSNHTMVQLHLVRSCYWSSFFFSHILSFIELWRA